jgi:3-oxoacyl-[acyl-carrier protein] reductase
VNIDLSGKKALVCGASKGIGRAAAEELAKLGASVTVMSRSRDKLTQVLRSLVTSNRQEHKVLVADSSDPEELKRVVTAFVNAEGPFHILVNNSGGPPAGPVHLASEPQFLAAFQQHLVSNHVMVQALLEGMKSEGYGRVINVISTSVKLPLSGLGVSNTIRGAVANWAKTLANEVAGFGITVNNVLPGATETDRLDEIFTNKAQKSGQSKEEIRRQALATIPAGRFGQPEELGQAIAFLASPAAGYINGINLPVDGGRTGCL